MPATALRPDPVDLIPNPLEHFENIFTAAYGPILNDKVMHLKWCEIRTRKHGFRSGFYNVSKKPTNLFHVCLGFCFLKPLGVFCLQEIISAFATILYCIPSRSQRHFRVPGKIPRQLTHLHEVVKLIVPLYSNRFNCLTQSN